MPTSNRPKELPVAAELSHLAIAGVKNKLAVTPQEAALFLLAEQMGLTECTWLEQKIPRAKDRRAIQGEETLPPADSAGVKPLSNLKFIKRKAADVNGGQLDETSRVLKSPRHA